MIRRLPSESGCTFDPLRAEVENLMVSTSLHEVLGMKPKAINSVIDLIPAPVFVTDAEGLLSDSNRAFRQMFKLDEQTSGQPLFEVLPEPLGKLVKQSLDNSDQEGLISFEAELDNAATGIRAVRVQQCGFLNKENRFGGTVGLIFDMTEEVRRFDRLRQLSILDELTSLPNRRHGLERVQNLLQQSQRNEFTFSFLILDIDNFKAVNDYEGHQAGDTVLRDIAEIIQELCRSYDLAFRYGGDEFIICLPNTGPEAAVAFGERIRSAVEAHEFGLQDSSRINCTVSIGVADYPGDGEDLEAILAAADRALYSAKQGGRNRVVTAAQTVVTDPDG